MEQIPAEFVDIFERETVATVATMLPDGTPHCTPVWIDYDGECVLVNTARGRQKERNARRNPAVGVLAMDPEDPYRYVSVQGHVVEVTEDGAVDHIDSLAARYFDVDEYPHHGEERGPRVIIRIAPDTVITSG